MTHDELLTHAASLLYSVGDDRGPEVPSPGTWRAYQYEVHLGRVRSALRGMRRREVPA